MYQRKITPLIQSLLLATLFSSGLMAAACSAESSNTKILSNQNTAAEIYELGVAYYEGDSVPEDDEVTLPNLRHLINRIKLPD